jgi:hypothetical protein
MNRLADKKISNLLSYSFINNNRLLENLDNELDILNHYFYKGYPHVVHNTISRFISNPKFNKRPNCQKKNSVIIKAISLRLKCKLDLCTPKTYPYAVLESKHLLSLLSSHKSEEIGLLFWVTAALQRINLVINPHMFNRDEISSIKRLLYICMKRIPERQTRYQVVMFLEIAKLALLTKEEKLFDISIDSAEKTSGKLPSNEKFLISMIWDVKARGVLRFHKDIYNTLESIEKADFICPKSYRAVRLYLTNTKLHLYESSGDRDLLAKAYPLRSDALHLAELLDNPYQKIRLQNKKTIGL